MYLVGKGALINATTGVEFPHYADLKLNFETKHVEVPFGDKNGADVIVTDQNISGHLGWEQVDVALLAALLGSASTSGTIKRVRLEEHSVPAAPGPYTVTMVKSTNIALTEIVKDADGNRLERVSANPASGQYSISAATLTFHSSLAGGKVYVDYFYSENTGKHIAIGPCDLPSAFKLVGCVRLAKSSPGDGEGDMVIVANRCVRTSSIDLGGSNGEVSGLGFDFTIVNRNPGDMTIYFP